MQIKEILEMARELGLLIRDTDECKNFDEALQSLEKNPKSKDLLNEFNAIMEEHHRRRAAGDIIESYEEKNRAEIIDKVKSDQILTKYITARENYIKMLTEIQNAIEVFGGA
jgi:cell fate (sporulation/competence/biofilm development) regulator YlbF (YheA/YmcA/DUF963 family)